MSHAAALSATVPMQDLTSLADEATGTLDVLADLTGRIPAPLPAPADGMGRELFALMRQQADSAELGASAMLAAAGL